MQIGRKSLFQKTLLLALLLAVTACGKRQFDIGKDDPEKELKKCLALSQRKHYEEATECLEIFKSRYPQTAQGEEAEVRIGDNYYNQKQYLLAADTYEAFVKLHPNQPQADYALYRAGLSYLKEAPKQIDRDQKYLVKANEHLETALRVNPRSAYRNAIIDSLNIIHERFAKRIYYIANFYYRTGEYISAIGRFKELAEKYPRSPLTPKALYHLVKAEMAEKQTESARQAVEVLVTNYSKNRYAAKAEKYYLNRVKK